MDKTEKKLAKSVGKAKVVKERSVRRCFFSFLDLFLWVIKLMDI